MVIMNTKGGLLNSIYVLLHPLSHTFTYIHNTYNFRENTLEDIYAQGKSKVMAATVMTMTFRYHSEAAEIRVTVL